MNTDQKRGCLIALGTPIFALILAIGKAVQWLKGSFWTNTH